MPTTLRKAKPNADAAILRTLKLMQRKEPLRADLRRYVEGTSTVLGTIIRHPFYVGPVDLDRAALVHHAIDEQQKALDRSLAAGKWDDAVFSYEVPFLLDGFLRHASRFDNASYWRLLGDVWTAQEQLWPNQQVFLSLFRARRPGREALMREDEHAEFGKLPDQFPVYRGFTGQRGKGMSWTTDRAKAEWFARRFAMIEGRGTPKVLSGVVRKGDVLAYFNRRQESEIVVEPAKVQEQRVESLPPKGNRRRAS